VRRVVDRDFVSALVLFFIGGVSLSAMGTGMRNWIFPHVLTYLILFVAALLVARVVLAAVLNRAPDLLRAAREDMGIFVDVLVFCAMVLAYILLVNGLGFWLSSFLMLSLTSIYLSPQMTLRNVGLAIVVPLIACALAYVVFLHLFYVPLPESTWWPGLD
jgi:Tripartite tricarboxylate transporter TctB family